jgi:hypothetical protein
MYFSPASENMYPDGCSHCRCPVQGQDYVDDDADELEWVDVKSIATWM